MEKTAPSSSISDCVLTRTAKIKSLSIRAFKSFGADVQTFNFSAGFNLIVGANGSGKSNILDAICFVLCSKMSALRVGSVSELQSADTKEPCEVSLDLQILGTSGKECDPVNLSVRILPNDMRQYKLNGKLKSMKEVKDFLKDHRLLVDETSAVVHQASVTELADKNSPFKLASIISAASGAGRWNEEVEIANKELKSTRAGLEEIQENIWVVESSIVEDNARLSKLLRAEQLEKEVSHVTKQLYKFQVQKLYSVQGVTSEKELRMKSNEAAIQEKLKAIEDKKAVLKKYKTMSKVGTKNFMTEKIKILDAVAVREEEISALEEKVKKVTLERKQLESSGLVLENLEMEISVLKKRLEEKQGMIEKLEVKSKTIEKTTNSDAVLQRHRNELRSNMEDTKLKLKKLHAEEQNIGTLLEVAERNLSYWETHLQSRRENRAKLLQSKEAFDLNARGKLEDKYKQCLDLKRSIEELQTQSQIMSAELGSLTLEESDLPAWPLHLCFTFKSDTEDIAKYMIAMNVIAGFIKKVCVTETTAAAAKLLQMWENGGNVSKFCRIWPLDRLKFEDDVQNLRSVQSLYPKGSVTLPIDLLQYDERFTKAIIRAFGNHVICLSDDIGRDLVIKNKIWNVTLDGKVNRIGSVSGGWRANENNSYLHIKLRKEKADQELASFFAKQSACEKDIKELEKLALDFETCKAKEEVVCQDIHLAEEEIKLLKKDVIRYQMQLQQCQKLIAFAQNDSETTKKQLDMSVEDLGSGSGLQSVKDALNDAKKEEAIIVEQLEKLQIQVEEAQANTSDLAQKVYKSKTEDVEQCIESKRAELQSLKTNLEQIDLAIGRIAHEEKLQTEMILLENEAIDSAEKSVEELKSENSKLQKEITQAKSEEEKIRNDMQELPNCPDDEAVELNNLMDIHGYAAAKRNLLKMIAELNQLHLEQQGISLAEQVAIKERAEKLQVFKERRASIIDSIDILMKGIEKSRRRVQEANEVVFQKVHHAFSEACNYLLPNKSVNIIKLGQHVEDGVKFTFCNRTQASKDVPNEWKTSLEELSGGQRTLLSLAFLLTVAISGQSPLYLLDEVDAALDEENQNRVAKLIKNIVSKGSQVICVSHHFSFQQQSDTVIQVTKADGATKLLQVYASS